MTNIKVDINNCNNISEGQFVMEKDKLNIKYGMNGTGKSTIATGLELLSKGSTFETLKTFGSAAVPSVNTNVALGKVLVFNEQFVNTIVFNENSLIENSFEVFIKTPDYDSRRQALDERLKALKVDLCNDEEIIQLRQDLMNFAGKLELNANKTELKTNNNLKSIIKKENLFNIPQQLKKYRALISDENLSIGWIDWKTKGEPYDEKGICPFCSDELKEPYRDEKEIFKNTYKKADSQNLKNMLDLFEQFEKYIEPSKYSDLISCIKKDFDEKAIKTILTSFVTEIDYLKTKLDDIEKFDSNVFKDTEIKDLDKLINSLSIKKVAINYFENQLMSKIVDLINEKIEVLGQEVAELKADMGSLRRLMQTTLSECRNDINAFLNSSGISYEVNLDIVDDGVTTAILRYRDNENSYTIEKIRNHLSWGERNAFALVLFMYYAISQKPDLIILDDPISSFDYNKKYAIIHRLFSKPQNGISKSFYRNTVLMLTHDFEPIIDFIVVGKIPPEHVSASYLKNNMGNLIEIKIDKNSHIRSFIQELLIHIKNDRLNMVHRIVFLRKYIEHHGIEGHMEAYDILSSFVHGRPRATIKDGTTLNNESITKGMEEIRQYISDIGIDYTKIITNYFNETKLAQFYFSETNNYLKLQLFRALMVINPISDVQADDPLMKFINESYHIENDYVYYMDLLKFDTVPTYIIEKVDKHMQEKYQEISV